MWVTCIATETEVAIGTVPDIEPLQAQDLFSRRQRPFPRPPARFPQCAHDEVSSSASHTQHHLAYGDTLTPIHSAHRVGN